MRRLLLLTPTHRDLCRTVDCDQTIAVARQQSHPRSVDCLPPRPAPVHLALRHCEAAHALLRSGVVQDALVLGVEVSNRLTLDGFAALQLLSSGRSQPFGKDRDGLVLGEAVAALRLSTRETGIWQMLGGAN